MYANRLDTAKNVTQTEENSRDEDAMEVDTQEPVIPMDIGKGKTRATASDSESNSESEVYEDGHRVIKDHPHVICLNDAQSAAAAAYLERARGLHHSKY